MARALPFLLTLLLAAAPDRKTAADLIAPVTPADLLGGG